MDKIELAQALDMVEKFDDLNLKEKNSLRLLTEELFSMTKTLLKNRETAFEIKREGKSFQLCMAVRANVGEKAREEFLSLSSKKENVASKGFMGKVISVLEDFIYPDDSEISSVYHPMMYGENFDMVWTMSYFIDSAPQEEQKKVWDGMEKSIIANFADDIVIGVRNSRVEIVIKKKFD